MAWIRLPTETNNKALKNAWAIKCKKDNKYIFKPRATTITPSCLSVERAIIFFISLSAKAEILAINIVSLPKINIIKSPAPFGNQYKWRINKYTPAVTRVDEWTREETGVGAAMAAGSQAENGIWALLVKHATTKIIISQDCFSQNIVYQNIAGSPNGIRAASPKIKIPSPKRLVMAVIIPALKDLLFP